MSATRARFDAMSAGYESFYLRACDPEGGLGVWIRYTVHRRRGGRPSGSLWFTLFEESGPTATKLTLPEPTAGGGDWIRIGDARIGDGVATGSAEDVEWDLRFTGEEPLYHLPRQWLYAAPLPRTKPVSVHPYARFDGTVRVRGRELALSGWPGMVGHNWGSQHAQRWIWLHGMGFAGAGSWVDLTFGRILVAGRLTPWIANGAISLDGERLALGGLGRSRRPRVAEAPDRLDFAVPGREIVVAGTASAPRERIVGWVYADPDGSEHHTANCSIADLTLRVARPDRAPVTLSAAGLGVYELGMRERDHGIPIQPFSDG